MINTGILRRLDSLGRVVIPIEIRNSMGLETKDAMAVYLVENDIFLKKVEKDEKIVGIIRFLDELGRVVLPIEIRNLLDLNEGEPVEIWLEENKIILRKHCISCIYCANQENLESILEKPVCKKCLKKIRKELS